MNVSLNPEIKMYILRTECDSINVSGFDTDLSRYYELFREGRKDDAKILYKNRLSIKYPDEERRVEILRYYRTKDPRFAYVYGQAVNELALRLSRQISRHIDGIILCFDDIGSNPMNVLKATQNALRKYFPGNIDRAFSMIERLESYVEKMEYREDEFYDIADLLKGYLDNSIFHSDEELKAAREQQKKEHMEAVEKKELERVERKKKKRKRYVIDLSKVHFSREDLAEIRIDQKLQRKALKVLAYCRLYWNKVSDPDFERRIFLYSKKYNTQHFDIFQTVKYNRLRKTADDVILLEVFNRLSKGYDYSISEDTFMRQAWQRIKPASAALPTPAAERKKRLPGTPQAARRYPKPKNMPPPSTRRHSALKPVVPAAAPKTGKPKADLLKPEPKQTVKPALRTPAKPKSEQAQPVIRMEQARPVYRKPVKAAEPRPLKPVVQERSKPSKTAAKAAAAAALPKPAAGKPKPVPKAKERPERKPPVRKKKTPRQSAPVLKVTPALKTRPNKPSLQEQINQLNGGMFKNYHRLFKSKLVNFIEEYLIRDALTLGHKKLEEANLEEAKGILHRFILENYSNADYDWIGSGERKKIEEIGFLVTEVFTITSRCLNFVKDKSISEEYKRMSRRQ